MSFAHHLVRLQILFFSSVAVSTAISSSSTYQYPILVVGATDGMGRQAIDGLLDAGCQPSQLRILSRNPETLKAWQAQGFGICQADLDNLESLIEGLKDCSGKCYVHSTGNDTNNNNTRQLSRARNLAFAISASTNLDKPHLVFNSVAGEPEFVGSRRQQSLHVENIFKNEFPTIDVTTLRSHLLMDEFWKTITRPAILKGRLVVCVSPQTTIFLTAVADIGRIAGACLLSTETTARRDINVAGDALTPVQMAEIFAKVQGSPCTHSRGRYMALIPQIFFNGLPEDFYFLRKTKISADIKALKQEFGTVTSLEEYLKESRWSDESFAYEDLLKQKIFDI
jgi:uncharacterized protein YbjT (DUF2867 family)